MNPENQAHAMLQSAGLFFELLQLRRGRGEAVSGDEWERLRAMCRSVTALPSATLHQKARADLMIVESHHWANDIDYALEAARQFVEAYSHPDQRTERATAHFVAASCLIRRGHDEDALEHLREIEREFGEESIWGASEGDFMQYMDIEVCFMAFGCLHRSGAPDSDVIDSARALVRRFPQSERATQVRQIAESEGWGPL